MAGQSHRDHHPLPHTSRQPVRVLSAPGGIGDVHTRQHLNGMATRRCPPETLMRPHDLGVCSPTVSSGFRLLIGS
jgi:hypothetical protein